MQLHFDRGTLLLSDVPPAWRDRIPPPFRWDPRVDAWRAPGRAYGALLKELRAGCLPVEDQVRAPGGAQSPASWKLPELRPYQATSLELWEQSDRRGIVVLPTGAGKTLLALAAIGSSSRQGLPRALCLVPTRALVEQWHAQFQRHRSGPVGIYSDGVRTLEALTVATYESAYRQMAWLGNRFDLLVIDECHHFGAGMRDEILEMATAPARLGLTATLPGDPLVQAKLAGLIGPVVFELGVGDLAGSYLSEFDYLRAPVALTPGERSHYEQEMRIFRSEHSRFRAACPGGTYQDWVRYAARTEEGRAALRSFREARRLLAYCQGKQELLERILGRHWAQRSLIFTSETRVAYQIAERHLIMPITAEIGRKEREEVLTRYRAGLLRALVSCRVLNEGIDVPDAAVAVILGGSLGPREHVQRIGRVLRPAPGKRAVVYELFCRDTIESRQSRRRSELLDPASTGPV